MNFLVKKFVISIIIRIFAASVLAKPLYNAQIVRGVFYLYTFEYGKSNEEFVLHFKRTYSEPYPPSWILGELLTIGNVNAIYRNIKQNRIRKRIAKRFGLPINVFESRLSAGMANGTIMEVIMCGMASSL